MPLPSRSLVRPWILALLGLGVLGAGGYAFYRLQAQKPTKAGAAQKPEVVAPTLESLDFQPQIQEGPLSLKDAPNVDRLLKAYKIQLKPEQLAFLEKNKFVLTPLAGTGIAETNNWDEMLNAFDRVGGEAAIEYRVPENTKLVTPDIVLHAFHKFFAMTQEQLEKAELRASLKQFLEGLLATATDAQKKAPPAASRSYDRIRAQVAVSLTLLENRGTPPAGYFENPEAEQAFYEADQKADSLEQAQRIFKDRTPGLSVDYTEMAAKELALIYAASAVDASPLFGDYDSTSRTDYTQYAPRSYYAKSSDLRAYFRAMMFLGRNSYHLKGDAGLTDALLLSGLFVRKDASGKRVSDAWQRVMDITALYAGTSDDVTYTEWRTFLKEAAGSESLSPEEALNPATLAKLRQNASKLRLPRILSELAADRKTAAKPLGERLLDSQAFRIFGQRFTYDAWILNRLTNETQLPATALFVPACLGDQRARSYAQAFVMKQPGVAPEAGPKILEAMDALAKEIAKEPASGWEGSMSAGWLDVLSTLTRSYGPGFPLYMQAEPFGDKQIQTFLGSYTELKHDTLLYAKPSYAEMGEGAEGPIPPVVKGFVEPNIHFWSKFSALMHRTRKFIESQDLFREGIVRYRLKEFSQDTDFYFNVAVKELKGIPVSDDDYETLRTKGLGYMAEPLSGNPEITEDSGKVALVADIHTDGFRDTVLYEGIGRPYLMLALVGNEKSPRLTLGLVFNHYEFNGKLGKRITDEDWKQQVYAAPPRTPEKNAWYKPLAAK